MRKVFFCLCKDSSNSFLFSFSSSSYLEHDTKKLLWVLCFAVYPKEHAEKMRSNDLVSHILALQFARE